MIQPQEIKKLMKDEAFKALLEKRLDELYDEFYKEKFSQVYHITYIEKGDVDFAEKLAEETADEYAAYWLKRIEDNVKKEVAAAYLGIELLEEDDWEDMPSGLPPRRTGWD